MTGSAARRPAATTDATPDSTPALALVPPMATGTAAPITTARARFSIRWIVALTAGALITAAVLAVGAVSERNARAALTHEIQTRLFLQARNLGLAAGDAMLADFPELTLHPLAKEMRQRQPELAIVDVLDKNGKIVGDSDPRRLGTSLDIPHTADLPATLPLAKGERLFRYDRVLVASVPVTHRDGRYLGQVFVGMRLDYLEGVMLRARRQQTIVLAIVLLIGVLGATIVMSRLLRPIAVLRDGLERIGRGDLNTPVRLHDATEFGLLAGAVNRMATQLKHAQSELLERERLSHELELARQIQASLLPSRGLRVGAFAVEGSNRAALEVGGDFYDFVRLADGRIALAIADVSGKGLAGCMVMSMLSALLRAYRDARLAPAELLTTLDAQLGATLQPGSFVTMWYGVLNPRTGELTFASAGHSPLLVWRRDGRKVESHRATGIPLGAVRGGAIARTLRNDVVKLGPGDAIVQFTDGVNEAFEPTGTEQFGMDRLEQLVARTIGDGPRALLEAAHAEVDAWVAGGPVLDDETLLVVTCVDDSTPAGRDPIEVLAEARTHGTRLELPARLDELDALDPWLANAAWAGRLERDRYEVLRTALHEALANVVEHGYGEDAALAPASTPHRVDLWCVTGAAGAPEYFVIRDHGRPFTAGNWHASDFTDTKVRKRGRGFGLDIIHRGMQSVRYHPETVEGNLTVLTFGTPGAEEHPS